MPLDGRHFAGRRIFQPSHARMVDQKWTMSSLALTRSGQARSRAKGDRYCGEVRDDRWVRPFDTAQSRRRRGRRRVRIFLHAGRSCRNRSSQRSNDFASVLILQKSWSKNKTAASSGRAATWIFRNPKTLPLESQENGMSDSSMPPLVYRVYVFSISSGAKNYATSHPSKSVAPDSCASTMRSKISGVKTGPWAVMNVTNDAGKVVPTFSSTAEMSCKVTEAAGSLRGREYRVTNAEWIADRVIVFDQRCR